ncbi:hypothetical protein [Providencia rustigianii]|uniref:hypothetical protein n=1 Tax=Providencia rustigianii TaxID=158850 RepID=UPI0035E5B5D0
METPKKNIPKVKRKKGDKSATASFFPKNKAVKKGQESRHSFSLLRAFSKLMNYGFSLFYVGFIISVWFFPENYSVEIIYNLTLILIFEFILVHSGVFMSVFQNIKVLLGFALFYGVFALAINAAVLGDSPVILYLYSATVINRMLFGITSRTDSERQENLLYSALMAVNFMFSIFFTMFLSWLVPYGGLTPEYLESIHYLNSIGSGGEFPEKPHVAFAFGVLYFSLPVVLPALFGWINWRNKRKHLDVELEN